MKKDKERLQVIENIRQAIKNQTFNIKVEANEVIIESNPFE